MARQEPTMPTTCDYCGKRFNTSRVHPRSYCSIACEEGRGAPPIHDPQSPEYHLHLKGDPEDLIGKVLIANGLKLVDYSPDWCIGPDEWSPGMVIEVDREAETYIRKCDVVIGRVYDYDGEYHINREHIESGEITRQKIKDTRVVSMIRQSNWWVEG